ncbi:DGC domain protein [Candidatus Vecturithrix granuli]|uniref:DGC domain protein n=1 Tax=Vecturithrix granuli TaxID=1499967 RepID=A0A081BWF0_VECG1|nr:DGC domain protein [Candidatus Vecturithrix granuli]
MEPKQTQNSCCDSYIQTFSCPCGSAPALLFPCSGGCDVGALTDLACRHLTAIRFAKMYCLAGISGRVSEILTLTRAAERIVVIDGCALNCAKATFEQAGFTNFFYLNLAEMGMLKDQSPVTNERILQIVNEVKNLP